MKTIARIQTDFPSKFGVPRQSGLVETEGRIVFEPEFRNADAVRGLEQYSHLWLLWEFSLDQRDTWSPTVRPPRLGGNQRVGVFATRSPNRPNSIGLSSVRLHRIEHTPHGAQLIVSGADLVDGTPIYDIKPYLPYTDCHPDAVGGFAQEHKDDQLPVQCAPELLTYFPQRQQAILLQLLAQDPRPQYQDDPDRIYGLEYAGFEIKFRVAHGALIVQSIQSITEEISHE